MKQITDVTPDGAHYIDDEGNEQFIDFATCQQNNIDSIAESMGSRFTNERRAFYQQAKYVGRRYALSDPPALYFYTVPFTVFEFSTRNELSEVLVAIKQAGWRTNDGE